MLQRFREGFEVKLTSIFNTQHLFSNNFWIFIGLISTLDYCNASVSVEQCCIQERIPNICVRTLCNPASPPSDFDVYDVFDRRNNCSRYLDSVAKCLAAGRDHSPCCSREAKDLEENACLCRGDGHFHRASAYQTCIALNLASMFSCFEKGYQQIPSPPRNLLIGQVSSTEAELSWQEPEHNAKIVDHYLLYIYELETGSEKADLSTELRIETVSKEARINQLEPGTRYLLQIIALGLGTSKDENELPRSLPTELRFKVLISSLDFFKKLSSLFQRHLELHHKLDLSKIKYTRLYVQKLYWLVKFGQGIKYSIMKYFKNIFSGNSTRTSLKIKWEHRQEKQRHGHFHVVEPINERISQSHYVFSKFRPRELLAKLHIRTTKPEDYGLYKCKVSDDFGETEATVHLAMSTVQMPLASPPEMPRQCCARSGVNKRCLLMCGMTDSENRRYVPRPFMRQNCSGEISKVLACAMPLVDESACCLIKEVPSQCLYLCDHQQKAPNLMPSLCLDYVATAEQCRLSGIQNRPSVVRNLKAQITQENNLLSTSISLLINYDNSDRADIYYIYWRSEGGFWQHRSSNGTSKKLILASSVNELVVVAANAFGFSQPSQLFLREGNWVKI